MASYVYVKNPNGTTYVYENESYWDKRSKKQSTIVNVLASCILKQM